MMERSSQRVCHSPASTSSDSLRGRNKLRRVVLLIAIVTCAVVTVWNIRSQLFQGNTYSLHRWIHKRADSRLLVQDDKPLIYTFYSPIVRLEKVSNREIKIAETDQQLLDVWKSSWADAGFHPIVLTLNDAKKHHYYLKYVDALSKVTLLGNGGRNQEYNEYCFVRYIAMVTVGGGILCDYDVMPLIGKAPKQPINDAFTVYQQTLNNAGGVPSLASGRANEWERIAIVLLQIARTEPSEGGWSDMVALMEAGKRSPETYVLRNEVVGYRDIMKDPAFLCKASQDAWAVHLSHYDVLSMGYRVHDRPQVAKEFLQKYKQICVDGNGVRASLGS